MEFFFYTGGTATAYSGITGTATYSAKDQSWTLKTNAKIPANATNNDCEARYLKPGTDAASDYLTAVYYAATTYTLQGDCASRARRAHSSPSPPPTSATAPATACTPPQPHRPPPPPSPSPWAATATHIIYMEHTPRPAPMPPLPSPQDRKSTPAPSAPRHSPQARALPSMSLPLPAMPHRAGRS